MKKHFRIFRSHILNKGGLSVPFKTLVLSVQGGLVSLAPDLATNFMYDTESPETLWAIQYSVDDGTPNGNLNEGNSPTSPWWSPYFSCCDFHKPSYNMVNAFKVDNNGLPLFDTFNDESARNSYHSFFTNNTFDPRIGHTVAIPGLPWKYQNQIILFFSIAQERGNPLSMDISIQ